ncbi:MAG: hypothetical protein M3251_00590 [Thermoproteota archaeon]|nr:hypothetical protein [Thermoproteota archaeon]MDQ3887749.1 hypothetical protein [Thermoproteota archaeon]
MNAKTTLLMVAAIAAMATLAATPYLTTTVLASHTSTVNIGQSAGATATSGTGTSTATASNRANVNTGCVLAIFGNC